jgi:hypothetical protein
VRKIAIAAAQTRHVVAQFGDTGRRQRAADANDRLEILVAGEAVREYDHRAIISSGRGLAVVRFRGQIDNTG